MRCLLFLCRSGPLDRALFRCTVAERAIPPGRCILRRITRHYDAEGNELITVDYFRRLEDIQNYRSRVGIDADMFTVALA